MDLTAIFMIVGFSLAAYSIVANDAIQTLGTFLSSNAHRPWWVLWLFACSILAIVLIYGWVSSGGDPAYGRLDKFPMPDGGISLMYLIPPFIILILTHFGVPVSTTFLVLSVFAIGSGASQNIGDMLIKSGLGYAVAFIASIVLYYTVFRRTTEYFDKTYGEPIPAYWTALQWCSTGFLWSQWLIQDLANIFAYLPRQLTAWELGLALVWLFALHAWIFKNNGGAIQKIVTTKTGTVDIRAATIIDFMYGIILFVFKEMSDIPMSTTWVFLGLLAGREFAISFHMYKPSARETSRIVGQDAAKAMLGLAVSLLLAFGLPVVFGLR
ncbi:hypothetical protein [Nitratireductor indicus]|uniref:Phosphate transporter n=1 Tax=Nitratireductor indicus C115 TaxID=1231190 RepID=K2P1R1_9HYPH|nr:hypothetical protein [Nitratireductor indicus]EKF44054.1 hypothetical protein NA8A_04560 [Nitratireductor indicus C115]MDS1135643.1 hypothetical protein [Nitratireductor indicus]SFQ11200.1 hypothetical protein SAMN05216176_101397 [Nitratireductor indicus]